MNAAIALSAAALATPAQALRTCADRWNQANMTGWGPSRAHVFTRPRCAIRIADGPRAQSLVCTITDYGAYWCTWIADGGPPLGKENARIDRRGVMTLEIPLTGTHPTPPLRWQRYPHVDGWILPWTKTGNLRRGLTISGRYRGWCVVAYEGTFPKGSLRCIVRSNLAYFEPCFRHRRAVVCAGAPGSTVFSRFVRVTS